MKPALELSILPQRALLVETPWFRVAIASRPGGVRPLWELIVRGNEKVNVVD